MDNNMGDNPSSNGGSDMHRGGPRGRGRGRGGRSSFRGRGAPRG